MLKKYLSILHISYKNHTIYFYDYLGNILVFALRVTVIMLFLKIIFDGSGSDTINGYNIVQLASALIFAQAVSVPKPRMEKDIGQEIKSGKIVTNMLNPISYIRYKFFEHISNFFINMIIFVVIGLLIIYFMFGYIDTSLQGFVASMILLIGSMLISFWGYTMIGMLAFFTEDASSFYRIYAKMDMLFGGNILPLPFLPGVLLSMAYWLPFAYGGYTAGLMFSTFELDLFIRYLLIQFGRIIIFITICHTMYHIAQKRMTVNGG